MKLVLKNLTKNRDEIFAANITNVSFAKIFEIFMNIREQSRNFLILLFQRQI